MEIIYIIIAAATISLIGLGYACLSETETYKVIQAHKEKKEQERLYHLLKDKVTGLHEREYRITLLPMLLKLDERISKLEKNRKRK